LKDKNGRELAHVKMMKNKMFKLNLKIKILSCRREGKIEDAQEIPKTFKSLEAQMVETKDAKNKAQVVTCVMKDELFNPQIDEESNIVVSKEDMHNLKRGYA